MARFISVRFTFIALSSCCLLACTAILGDFEVAATSASTDSGATDGAATDGGGQTDAAPDGATANGFSAARLIAAGARHTCVIANLGEVYCWGDNSQGQLGQPASVPRLAKPRKVNLNGVAKAISSGANHTCVVMMNDDIQCWGQNGSGQSGTGDNAVIAPPHVVRAAVPPAQRQWALVAAGAEHTCAVDQGGQTYCWGANDGKQSGFPAATPNANLATTAGLEKLGYAVISASTKHTCAAKPTVNGTQCWGTETKGALGNGGGGTDTTETAVNVTFPGETKQLASGAGHSCLLDAQGDARCWGDNAMGQLGANGASFDVPAPKLGAAAIVEIAAGGDTTCGISSTGRVLACVGSNSKGQLGIGSSDSSAHPNAQPVQRNATSGLPLDGVAHVAVGREHACAIVGTSGEVFCWGLGSDGQLGDGTSGGDARPFPVQVAGAE